MVFCLLQKGCLCPLLIRFPDETVVVFVVMAVGAMFIDPSCTVTIKPISLKSAVMWSIFWVMMAMAFAGFYTCTTAGDGQSVPDRLRAEEVLRRQPVCDDGDLRLVWRAG